VSQLSVDEQSTRASAVRERYEKLTPESRAAYEKTLRVVGGGTSRQTGHWFPYPLTIVRGQGSRVWDLDGREYLDLINNYTSLIHGHAYPPVTEVVCDRVAKGTAWSANNLDQLELAARIVARVPSVDSVRFTNSGSEAAALALQVARALTGRNKLLMARYGYHGVIADFQTGSLDQPGPSTLLGRFNDAASFVEQLRAHGPEIAGVFLEPMLGAGGVLAARPEFLREVIAATRAAGAVFVLDEVQTFRMSTGGLQQVFGVEPDLTLFGKFVGGGFPVGAVGGRAEVMQVFDATKLRVYHSGTFNANPITMAAGNVTVRDLTADAIRHMEQLAERFRTGIMAAAARLGLPISVNQLGSLLNVYFMPKPPETAWQRSDQDLMQRFHLAALNHGLFFAHRGFFVLSTVLTAAEIDEAIERAAAAMADAAAEV
jgi:glutamate-1-semialdehyde 2,1-aminomutase